MNDLLRPIVQGQDYRYSPTDERAGIMQVHYNTDRTAPKSAYLSSMIAVELVFHLCGVNGAIGEPEVTSAQSARYLVRW